MVEGTPAQGVRGEPPPACEDDPTGADASAVLTRKAHRVSRPIELDMFRAGALEQPDAAFATPVRQLVLEPPAIDLMCS